MAEEQKRDIIILMKGGTIQGIFSAGVVTAFQKHNLYPRIDSVYAVSSGAHNAAYFLSEQIDQITPQIFYDFLYDKHKFLKDLSFKTICKKFWQLFAHNKGFNIIDLDYVEKLEREMIKLDVEKIKNSPIKFYVRVFDPKTHQMRYLDGKENTIPRLIQSSKVPPYAFSQVLSDEYFDGGIMPSRDFIKNIIKTNPDKTILYIFNDKKTPWRVFKYLPWDILDIIFKTRYLGLRYGLKHLFNIFNYPYIHSLKKYKHVHIVYDEACPSKREKSRDRIYRSYEHGLKKGEIILRKVGHLK